MSDDRSSRPHAVAAFEAPDEETRARLEAENGLQQFDRMVEMIEAGLAGRFRLRPSQLLELNRLAVEGLLERPGTFRLCEIEISGTDHTPPPPNDVPALVEEMCDYVNDHWNGTSALHLSAYMMWRLNWIHPFADGNGRTSRAVSYLVLNVRTGHRLPGTVSIPERIAGDKTPYYHALDAADAAWKKESVDVSVMEDLLQDHLAAQLLSVFNDARGS